MPGMGLRGRLTLFFVAITVVPSVVAMGLVQAGIGDLLRERAEGELAAAGRRVAALVEAARVRAGDLATDLGEREGLVAALASAQAAQAWLAGQPLGDRADIVVLAAPDGGLLAHQGTVPPGADPADVARQAAAVAQAPETPPDGLLLEVRVVPSMGLLATGVWLDDDLLHEIAPDPATGSGAAFVADGRVLAATGSAPALARPPPRGTAVRDDVAGEPVLVGATDLPAAPGVALLLWTPVPVAPGLALMVVVPAAAVLAAAVIGLLLAGSVIAPVKRAADHARAAAGGDLSRQLSPSGGRELADLAHALNTMSSELAARLAEVERSRDELRQSLTRLGEALSGTLDLDRMLTTVAHTAADTLRADGVALLLVRSDGEQLEPAAVRGTAPARGLRADEGVVGHALRTGLSVRLPGTPGVPPRAPAEPTAPYLLVVPLRGRARTNGVLVLQRDAGSGEFDDHDLDTAGTIAAGIAVAVENIRLHEETQRLSLTNPVTGLWNARYFEPQVDAELARARRANERGDQDREVSVLMIDLDSFGRINKDYSQEAGDAALAEIGRRLADATREPDVVANAHGDEFSVLLPDTDFEGAVQVAERVRAAVSRSPVELPGAGQDGEGVHLDLTCSVGVATFPLHATTRKTLYRAADRALQLAKQRGRNQVAGAGELVTD